VARTRVILAEDHAEMAQQLRSLLNDYDVEVVTNGQGLIAAVNANEPDVIVSDIAMPGTDGLTAARAILATHPVARILFVSVRDEPAIIEKAMAGGACGYVVKSDAGEELLSAVQTVLGGGRYFSASARAALNGGSSAKH
jgi:DNA-binding NarL/FixJ family response regulator